MKVDTLTRIILCTMTLILFSVLLGMSMNKNGTPSYWNFLLFFGIGCSSGTLFAEVSELLEKIDSLFKGK